MCPSPAFAKATVFQSSVRLLRAFIMVEWIVDAAIRRFFRTHQHFYNKNPVAGILDTVDAHERETRSIFKAAAKFIGASVQHGGIETVRAFGGDRPYEA